MAKGPYLTDRIKSLIAGIYNGDPQIKPTKARTLLLKSMREEGLNETFGSDFPSVSAVSKVLKELREMDEARPPHLKKLDRPWSITTLSEYPVSPEALPTVLEGWMAAQAKEEPLTIREAQWISHIYPVAKACAERMKNKDMLMPFLQCIAHICAAQERIEELIKTGPHSALDLTIYEFMTGLVPTPELVNRILPDEGKWSITETGWHLKITKEEARFWEDIWQKLRYSNFIERTKDLSGVSVEVCEDIGTTPPQKKGGKT